jgi:hypothetical protein
LLTGAVDFCGVINLEIIDTQGDAFTDVTLSGNNLVFSPGTTAPSGQPWIYG